MGVLISSQGGGHLLKACNVAGLRGTARLFQALNFEVQAGHLLWVRGPNGCGKTTLLRMLAGLSLPEDGDILWDGMPIRKETGFRQNLVYLGHSNGLKDDLTAMESLQFLSRIHGRTFSTQAIEAALRRLGVFHRRMLPVRTLSQGQRKRVALARLALESNPGLWVLDEPFDTLDDHGMATVNELLGEHLQRGGNVTLTSHIPVHLEHQHVNVLMLGKAGQV